MDPRLKSYISTRDQKLAKDTPWSPTPLADNFEKLLTYGAVVVGGRATCGTKRDPTWTAYCLWRQVVSKAISLGYPIKSQDIKQGNAWATKAGGFWEESLYSLETDREVK